MDEDRITKKALFRYQIISAFLAADPPRGSRYKLLEQLAAKQWVLEDGRTLIVQPETIRHWIRLYRTGGFEALKDVPRKDTGVRSIPGGLVEEACRLKKEVPERSIEQIITIMERMGKAPEGLLARSTLHRALRARGLSARSRKPPAHSSLGRFQADYANDLWQADMLTGPWLPDPDRPAKHRRCYLYAFLDDASRLLLYGRFSFKGDLPALELVMKRAIQRYGKPRRVYVDYVKLHIIDVMLRFALCEDGAGTSLILNKFFMLRDSSTQHNQRAWSQSRISGFALQEGTVEGMAA